MVDIPEEREADEPYYIIRVEGFPSLGAAQYMVTFFLKDLEYLVRTKLAAHHRFRPGGGGGLDLDLEGAILEDGDEAAHDLSVQLARAVVEHLDELSRVDAVGAQSGTERGCRRRLTSGGRDLERSGYLLGHVVSYLPPRVIRRTCLMWTPTGLVGITPQ